MCVRWGGFLSFYLAIKYGTNTIDRKELERDREWMYVVCGCCFVEVNGRIRYNRARYCKLNV